MDINKIIMESLREIQSINEEDIAGHRDPLWKRVFFSGSRAKPANPLQMDEHTKHASRVFDQANKEIDEARKNNKPITFEMRDKQQNAQAELFKHTVKEQNRVEAARRAAVREDEPGYGAAPSSRPVTSGTVASKSPSHSADETGYIAGIPKTSTAKTYDLEYSTSTAKTSRDYYDEPGYNTGTPGQSPAVPQVASKPQMMSADETGYVAGIPKSSSVVKRVYDDGSSGSVIVKANKSITDHITDNPITSGVVASLAAGAGALALRKRMRNAR